MRQCEKCLAIESDWVRYDDGAESENYCKACGEKYVTTGTEQENQGGAATQDSTGKEADSIPEEITQEDTSKGIKYSGLLTDWVVGYREWRVTQRELVSPVQHYGWEKGLQKADYINEEEGGFYAYHYESVDSARGLKPRSTGGGSWNVWGVVKAKGDIYVYETGFRAQYARVVALGFDPDWKYVDVMNFKRWAKREYGAKCVMWMMLRLVSHKYGTPVPESVRPCEDIRELQEDDD